MPYYDVFNEDISVNMSVSIAMRVVYLCVFISCKALMVQCTTNIYFLLFIIIYIIKLMKVKHFELFILQNLLLFFIIIKISAFFSILKY